MHPVQTSEIPRSLTTVSTLIGDNPAESLKVFQAEEIKKEQARVKTEQEAIEKAKATNMNQFKEAYQQTISEVMYGPKSEGKADK